MNTFNDLKSMVQEHIETGDFFVFVGNAELHIFTPNENRPITTLLSLHNKLEAKIVFTTSDKVKLYFLKQAIPYQIDYTSFEFSLTDKLISLVSESIVSLYPNARTVYQILSGELGEGE